MAVDKQERRLADIESNCHAALVADRVSKPRRHRPHLHITKNWNQRFVEKHRQVGGGQDGRGYLDVRGT